MHFIILGTGAIGSYIGGRLAAAGESVSFVARPYRQEALRNGALRVTDLDGFIAEVPTTQLHLADHFQAAYAQLSQEKRNHLVVLVCVKGGATIGAAQEIAACTGAASTALTIISLQNGVDNIMRLKEALPLAQVLGGMVPYNVVMQTHSHVHRATRGKVQLQASPVCADITARWNAAGIHTSVAQDITCVQWGKLLLNLNNPINALSNKPLLDQLHDRNFRVTLAALQREALSVMACEGIAPAQLATVSPGVMPYLLCLPNFIFTRLATQMLRMDPTARSSMWDDIQRDRVTEVDDLCGAVVRLGLKHRIPTPINAKMCELITQLRKGESMTGQALRQALQI